jgi:hypothetical protein
MDINAHVVYWLVEDRLAEARAAAARSHLGPPRTPSREAPRALGAVLVRLGRRLAGGRRALAPAPTRAPGTT